MKTFSFRFDIDSLADIEVGVPKLIELAKELDVRFTFFVNMGTSFRWSVVGGQLSAKSETRRMKPDSLSVAHYLLTVKRLGLLRAIRTVIFNPDIGLSHKKILFKLLDNGHELGLHGGMDHPLWQRRLDQLSKDEINDLLKPAYDNFVLLFGRPRGFASPGFRYNEFVLELIDEYGLEYASDMEGEGPFKPEVFNHLQIPVNIIGPCKAPIIEHLTISGLDETEVLNRCGGEIAKRESAVIYGHPAGDGLFNGLRALLSRVSENGYRIMPMSGLSGQPREIVKQHRLDTR